MKFSDLSVFDDDASHFNLLVSLREDRVRNLLVAILLVQKKDCSIVSTCAHAQLVEIYENITVISRVPSSLKFVSERAIDNKEKLGVLQIVCERLD